MVHSCLYHMAAYLIIWQLIRFYGFALVLEFGHCHSFCLGAKDISREHLETALVHSTLGRQLEIMQFV